MENLLHAQVEVKELLEKLTKIKSYTSSNPKIHSHGEVQIDVTDKIILRAYDGDTTAEAEISGNINHPGTILVNPKNFQQFLNCINPETILDLEVTKKNDLQVSGLSEPYYFRGSLQTHPSLKIHKYKKVALNKLEAALNSIKDTIGNGGVQIVSLNTNLSLNATDNYRLGHCELEGAGFGEFTGNLPYSTLDKISKINPNKIFYDDQSKTLTFTNEVYTIQTRLLISDFPSAGGLIDTIPELSFTINKGELQEKLKRLEAVAENQPIKIYCEEEYMCIEAKNTDTGYGQERVKISIENNQEIELHIHLKYLLQAVNSIESNELQFHYNGSLAPLFVTGDTATKTLHVIMPVRS